IVIVRPASVILSNLFSDHTSWKERIFLSLLAPRGIVAAAITSVFALEIEHAAHEGRLPESLIPFAHEMVPLVFIVIIGTVAFYGLLAAPLARKLGLAKKNPDGIIFAGASTWARTAAKALNADGHAVLLLDTRFENIADAKMDGLRAVRANILSEYVEEEMDFSGLGHLIAGTPNDEVNSLASREYAHHFGKAAIWQVTPEDAKSHHTKAVSSRIRGRLCFSGSPTFRQLESFALRGAVVKKTQLTDVFTINDFRKVHGDEAIILFLHDAERGLRPYEADRKEKLPEEVTLYAFVIPEEENGHA
ncbi:MAG: NAD-binding protein, partial [Verrucomicrobiales bacterium]